MPRETSPLIVGEYWLDKRRDGKSPDVWQIATYSGESRSVVYRSTKCRTVDLEKAKGVLRSHEADQRSTSKNQQSADAEILPHLFNYLREQGPDIHRLDTVKSSFRAWIGFLMQDELGTGATVSQLDKVSVGRFRRWRMGEHNWEVEWGGKVFRHSSKGVTGEAVQRNIDDIRAALHHAEDAKRITAPKIPSVDKKLRSKSRKHLFTVKELGAMIAYADHEPDVQRWLWLMIGTAARPDAALQFRPESQWQGNIIDLHPDDAPVTDKRNAVVPAIEPLQRVLEAWPSDAPIVTSRKRWWRTMRRKLAIPESHIPKTIRHTVASHLRNRGVPGEQISTLLGHKDQTDTLERTSEIYAHADPLQMKELTRALTTFWASVEREATRWRADHLLTITANNDKVLVERKRVKC